MVSAALCLTWDTKAQVLEFMQPQLFHYGDSLVQNTAKVLGTLKKKYQGLGDVSWRSKISQHFWHIF